MLSRYDDLIRQWRWADELAEILQKSQDGDQRALGQALVMLGQRIIAEIEAEGVSEVAPGPAIAPQTKSITPLNHESFAQVQIACPDSITQVIETGREV